MKSNFTTTHHHDTVLTRLPASLFATTIQCEKIEGTNGYEDALSCTKTTLVNLGTMYVSGTNNGKVETFKLQRFSPEISYYDDWLYAGLFASTLCPVTCGTCPSKSLAGSKVVELLGKNVSSFQKDDDTKEAVTFTHENLPQCNCLTEDSAFSSGLPTFTFDAKDLLIGPSGSPSAIR